MGFVCFFVLYLGFVILFLVLFWGFCLAQDIPGIGYSYFRESASIIIFVRTTDLYLAEVEGVCSLKQHTFC